MTDLPFWQELVIAIIGGLIAGLGGGAVVYTGLASAEQRRDVRNRLLDLVLDSNTVEVACASAAAAPLAEALGVKWPMKTESRSLNKLWSLNQSPYRYLTLSVDRIRESASLSERSSWYDAWVLRRLHETALDRLDVEPEKAAESVVAAHWFLQRRVRSARFGPAYLTSAALARRKLSNIEKYVAVWPGDDLEKVLDVYRRCREPFETRNIGLLKDAPEREG